MLYFIGSEITEPKVCGILWYLRKDVHNMHDELEDHESIQEDRTAWINVSVF